MRISFNFLRATATQIHACRLVERLGIVIHEDSECGYYHGNVNNDLSYGLDWGLGERTLAKIRIIEYSEVLLGKEYRAILIMARKDARRIAI